MTVWPEVPGYTILEEIGRGGMGVVYRARQVSLERIVALKMLHTGPGRAPDLVARLRGEAETIARLHHPNIVQVHEVGTCAAGPFLVMEFIGGGSLGSRLEGAPQPSRTAALVVQTLARAVHAAHEKGIVHRDLKPGNILVVEDTSAPLENCTLKICDFGLARRLDEVRSLTLSGQVVGTPGYMPPEQAQGPSDAIGPSADVYALGVLLYEALTGRPPFNGATALETVHLMLQFEPLPPSRLRRQLPRDLETICLCCLQKDPSRRYGSAAHLADDLERFLRDKPILARRTPVWERLGKWARRQPGTASLAGCLVALVLVGFSLITWQWRRAESAHERSELERARAVEIARAEVVARREAQRLSARLLMERGTTLCEAGDHGAGLLWLARSLESLPASDRALSRSARLLMGGWGQQLHPFCFHVRHPAKVDAVVCCRRTGKLFTASGKRVFTWDLERGTASQEPIRLSGRVLRLVGTPAGVVAVCEESSRLAVWSLANQTIPTRIGPVVDPGSPVCSVALSPDGQWLLTGLEDHSARLFRVATGREGSPWPHDGPVRAVAFSPDGRAALTGCDDGQVRLWAVPSGQPGRIFQDQRRPIVSVAFDAAGTRIAAGSLDNQARIWDRRTGQLRATLRGGHEREIRAIAFHPTEALVATGGPDDRARLWDANTGDLIGAILRHADDVVDLTFTPDGGRLATASDDGTVRVWQVRPSSSKKLLRHPGEVLSLARSHDGKHLLTSCADGGLRLWDLATRSYRVVSYQASALGLDFSPDGKTFAAGFYDGQVRLYDTRSAQPLGEGWTHAAPLLCLGFSPDGRLLATGCEDGETQVIIREVRTGQVRAKLSGHTRKVRTLAFSPDGTLLLTGSWDRTARLWNVAQGRQVALLPHQDLVQAVAFGPDGTLALTGSDDYTSRLWDVPSGTLRGVPLRHPDKVQSVAFAPSGHLFATAGKGQQVRLWDLGSGKPIGLSLSHGGEVHGLAFSRDGKTLYSGSWDGTVKPWRVPIRQRGDKASVRRWLEVHTGQKLNESGVVVPLDLPTWENRVEEERRSHP